MCGFAGYVSLSNVSNRTIHEMTDCLIERGPDDAGFWSDAQHGIFLGHRRLAVVDLTSAGNQPMSSPSGRYVMVFNGEIYNHVDLRDILKAEHGAVGWRGHSDTETLLACIAAWGVARTLEKCVGMFAIAVWDREDRTLILARDRLGEKPLYFGWINGSFVFASQLKAIALFPGFSKRIDLTAAHWYFRHGYVPTPLSIFDGIQKAVPGTIHTLAFAHGNRPEILSESYWSISAAMRRGLANPFVGSAGDAADTTAAFLRESIAGQLVADVPVGAFLSGGVDSSLVVAISQELTASPLRTFSIGFENPNLDEAKYAKRVANYLGTDHTELYVTDSEALSLVDQLAEVWDEPFADSSQVPTLLLAKLARTQVTVSLSGDGGDELFAGYDRYGSFLRKETFPMGAILNLGRRFFPTSAIASVDIAGLFMKNTLNRERIALVKELLRRNTRTERYESYVTHWHLAEMKAEAHAETFQFGDSLEARVEGLSTLQLITGIDLATYLRDDILVKLDRAAMASSLETRVPFLDHRLVEFACTLTDSVRILGGVAKWPVKSALIQRIPRELIDRPKMGFGIPLAEWLRGPLQTWASDLLHFEDETTSALLGHELVNEMWAQHLASRFDWAPQLWNVLMWKAWYRAHCGH